MDFSARKAYEEQQAFMNGQPQGQYRDRSGGGGGGEGGGGREGGGGVGRGVFAQRAKKDADIDNGKVADGRKRECFWPILEDNKIKPASKFSKTVQKVLNCLALCMRTIHRQNVPHPRPTKPTHPRAGPSPLKTPPSLPPTPVRPGDQTRL